MTNRLFSLLLLALCLTWPPSLRGQTNTDAPRRYKITVWVVRPTVKRVPTYRELEADRGKWHVIKSLLYPNPVTDDRALLARLNKDNPLFHFSRIEHKTSRIVKADEVWSVDMPSTSTLTLRVCEKDRPAAVEKMSSGGNPEQRERTKEYLRERLILETAWRVRRGTAKSMSRGTGYYAVQPKTVNAISPIVQYDTIVPKGGVRIPEEEDRITVRHAPADILLFSVQPLP